MFKITKNHTFTHTVTVQTPVDGDDHREDTFKARFKMLPSNEAETVLDTQDVVGEDEKLVPHSPELLEQLIGVYAVRMALVNTYFAAVTKARLGN